MVRAFDIFHFEGQLVETIHQPNLTIPASNNRLLISRKDNAIEVYDLPADSVCAKRTKIFPVVDNVKSIIHCSVGNYVATIETSHSSSKFANKCRVYTNWYDMSLSPPLTNNYGVMIRARIASQVTPTRSETDNSYFDMIEIPLSDVSCISCCQTTGKLLVCCSQTVYIYRMLHRSHKDLTSVRYIDFELDNPSSAIIVNFFPVGMTVVDDVIVLYRMNTVLCFRIEKIDDKSVGTMHEIQKSAETSVIDDDDDGSYFGKPKQEAITDETNVISIDKLIQIVYKDEYIHQLKNHLDENSFPLAVHLPAISETTQSLFKLSFNREDDNIVRFKDSRDRSECVIKRLSYFNQPLNVHVEDNFKHVVLEPLYLSNESDSSASSDRSTDNLFAILYLIATTYEAFLYVIPMRENYTGAVYQIATYKFTAALKSIYLDHYILHALTEVGIETFSLPSCRYAFHTDKIVYSEKNDVTLLGIHPFIGVVDFVVTENYMIIFASPNQTSDKNWTVYYLNLPNAMKVCHDMESIVNNYKNYDDDLYFEIIAEMFGVLYIASNFTLKIPITDKKELEIRYKSTLLEFVQYYFKKDDIDYWKTGTEYSLRLNVDVFEVIAYISSQIDEQKPYMLHGLQYFVKKWIRCNRYLITASLLDELIEKLKIGNDYPCFFSYLVLTEQCVREVAGSKILSVLKTHFKSTSEHNCEEILAICVLYIMRGQTNEATVIFNKYVCLSDGKNEEVIDKLTKYTWLLFEQVKADNRVSLSEFASFCIEKIPTEFGHLLAKIVLEEKYILEDLLTGFSKSLTCQTTQNSSTVLKIFLELLYSTHNQERTSNFIGYDTGLMMLMRSYLADLMVQSEANGTIDVEEFGENYTPIFSKKALPEFLNFLPTIKGKNSATIKKLQDLIHSGLLTEKSMEELRHFINVVLPESVRIHLLVLINDQFIVPALVDTCPEAVIPFGKSIFKDNRNWTQILKMLADKDETNSSTDIYRNTIKSLMNYLAYTAETEQFDYIVSPVFPKSNELYQHYYKISKHVDYANDIRKTVITKGQQLLDLCT